jgi:hypothetical protein
MSPDSDGSRRDWTTQADDREAVMTALHHGGAIRAAMDIITEKLDEIEDIVSDFESVEAAP